MHSPVRHLTHCAAVESPAAATARRNGRLATASGAAALQIRQLTRWAARGSRHFAAGLQPLGERVRDGDRLADAAARGAYLLTRGL